MDSTSVDLSISYELDWEDYLESQTVFNRQSPEVARNIKRTRTSMASLYVFLLLILYPALAGLTRLLVLGAILLLAVAHILGVRKLYEWRVNRVSRRIIKKAQSDRAIGAKRLRLHGEELFYKEESGTRKFAIGDIKLILESDRSYFLFADEATAIILPKVWEGEAGIQAGIIAALKARPPKPEEESGTGN